MTRRSCCDCFSRCMSQLWWWYQTSMVLDIWIIRLAHLLTLKCFIYNGILTHTAPQLGYHPWPCCNLDDISIYFINISTDWLSCHSLYYLKQPCIVLCQCVCVLSSVNVVSFIVTMEICLDPRKNSRC